MDKLKTEAPCRFLMFLAIGITISSCKDEQIILHSGSKEFHMTIDSLKVPKLFVQGDTLKAQLWGIIGPTNCYEFSRYKAVRDSFEIRIWVYGKKYPSSACDGDTVALQGAIYRVWPSYPGKFNFWIVQPDGSLLGATTMVL